MFIQLFLEFQIPLYSTQASSHHEEEILVADTCDPQLSPVPSKCINSFSSNSVWNKGNLTTAEELETTEVQFVILLFKQRIQKKEITFNHKTTSEVPTPMPVNNVIW